MPPINNNNIIENNNNPGQAAPVAEVVAAPAENVAVDENQPPANIPTDEVTNEETATRTSVMALIRTFVLSFFTSLIPETPAL